MKEFVLAALVLQLPAVGCHLQSQRTTYASPDSPPFRAIHLPVGTHPSMLSIADVNRDGNADILVATGGSGNLSVYLGDGKGGFSQPNGSPFSAGQNPTDIGTGDFNGDGNLDIAIANHGVKSVTVLLGKAKDNFHSRQVRRSASRAILIHTELRSRISMAIRSSILQSTAGLKTKCS